MNGRKVTMAGSPCLTSLDQLRPAKRVKQAVTGNLGVSWIRLLETTLDCFKRVNLFSMLFLKMEHKDAAKGRGLCGSREMSPKVSSPL